MTSENITKARSHFAKFDVRTMVFIQRQGYGTVFIRLEFSDLYLIQKQSYMTSIHKEMSQLRIRILSVSTKLEISGEITTRNEHILSIPP